MSKSGHVFYALGYTADGFDKPMIGIANGHSTITPCNAELQKLVDAAATAIQLEGPTYRYSVFRPFLTG